TVAITVTAIHALRNSSERSTQRRQRRCRRGSSLEPTWVAKRIARIASQVTYSPSRMPPTRSNPRRGVLRAHSRLAPFVRSQLHSFATLRPGPTQYPSMLLLCGLAALPLPTCAFCTVQHLAKFLGELLHRVGRFAGIGAHLYAGEHLPIAYRVNA